MGTTGLVHPRHRAPRWRPSGLGFQWTYGRHVFASLPTGAAARVAVANQLLSDAYTRTTEEDLLGVYGFERTSRSPRADVAFLPRVAGAALLEFARDEQGRLIGFQYAPDAPALDNKGKPKKRLTGGALRHGRTRPRRAPHDRCWYRLLAHRGDPQGKSHV